jgi:hypothetical protein
LSRAVGSASADKRKSVAYAPSVDHSPEPTHGGISNGHFSRPAGAKSMPASRRTSASSHDEELAGHLQGLSLAGEKSTRASPTPTPTSASVSRGARYGQGEGGQSVHFGLRYNAGMMLDQQLDREMHSLSFFLCILHDVIL